MYMCIWNSRLGMCIDMHGRVECSNYCSPVMDDVINKVYDVEFL